MIIDQAIIDTLKSRYRVFDIESRYSSECYLSESMDSFGEIKMLLTHGGFERLIRDLFGAEKTAVDVRDIFSVSPMEIESDKGLVYVAKYPTDRYPMEMIAEYGEKLRKALEAEGQKVILMPQTFDVSLLTIEQLTQVRDNLTELIQSLSYDNIIGF